METTEYTYKKAFTRIRSGFFMLLICILNSIATFFKWLWNLIVNNKIATALVISVIANIILVLYGMNTKALAEHYNYRSVQFEQKYDSVRHAYIRYSSINKNNL